MAEGAASVFSALHCPLDFPDAYWTPHECFLDISAWCVQNWSSASAFPFPSPNPASFSFFISVNGIFILLVGLVRNLGFILDSFLSPFPTAHPRASPINVTFRTQPESETLLLPLLPPWARLLSFRRLQCSPHGPPSFHPVHSCPHPRLSTATRRTALKKHVRSPPCSKDLQGSPSHSETCQTPYCDLRCCWKRPASPFHLISSLLSCFSLRSSHCSINMPRTLCLKHLTVAVPSVWNAFPSEVCMACPSFLCEGSPATLHEVALTVERSLASLPCFTFLCSSWPHCTYIFTYLFCCLSPPSWRKASRGQGLIAFTVSLMHRVPPGIW